MADNSVNRFYLDMLKVLEYLPNSASAKSDPNWPELKVLMDALYDALQQGVRVEELWEFLHKGQSAKKAPLCLEIAHACIHIGENYVGDKEPKMKAATALLAGIGHMILGHNIYDPRASFESNMDYERNSAVIRVQQARDHFQLFASIVEFPCRTTIWVPFVPMTNMRKYRQPATSFDLESASRYTPIPKAARRVGNVRNYAEAVRSDIKTNSAYEERRSTKGHFSDEERIKLIKQEQIERFEQEEQQEMLERAKIAEREKREQKEQHEREQREREQREQKEQREREQREREQREQREREQRERECEQRNLRGLYEREQRKKCEEEELERTKTELARVTSLLKDKTTENLQKRANSRITKLEYLPTGGQVQNQREFLLEKNREYIAMKKAKEEQEREQAKTHALELAREQAKARELEQDEARALQELQKLMEEEDLKDEEQERAQVKLLASAIGKVIRSQGYVRRVPATRRYGKK